ncbi:MAG: hypothetical protein KatS3mg060_0775 [Dehalococcoidia bacterium]|nr:MAG: hypothetical protein KatS3mg060_0775 [Dehalococcoidia bacterium]
MVHSAEPIAELGLLAFASAAYPVSVAASHLVADPAPRRVLFYALSPPIATAILLAIVAGTCQWANAGFVALVAGGAGQAAIGTGLLREPP